MKQMRRNLFLGIPLFFLCALGVAHFWQQVFSSELTGASATLSNARLSFVSALEGAQTVGSSLISIDTSNYPSESVLQLQNRDSILINGHAYTVATTIDDGTNDKLNLTAALASGDEADNTSVIGIQTSTLTIRFTTVSALTGGSFRVLVPARDNTSVTHDGTPDADGFDFGSSTTASITCPATAPVSYGTFTATNANAEAGVTLNGVDYHVFTCSYTGNGEVGTAFGGGTYTAFTISNLINPAPKQDTGTHTLGSADTYPVIIQHLDASNAVIDQTTTKVGVVDAVKVSATIAPQLTFTVAGENSGTSACGGTTGVTTQALAVPFGELPLGSFMNASQLLTVVTNASAGYVVTAIENDQLGRNGNVCTGDGSSSNSCIVDASVSGISHTTSADWTSTSDPGFGYSLQVVTAGITPAFYYNESARTFSAKQFADQEDGQAPQTLFSRSTVAQNDQVRVCYRILAAVTNVAGDYENYLVYTASATF